MKSLRRFLPAAAFLFSVCFSLAAQNSAPRIVYRSRAYQCVGASHEQWWEMDLTTRQQVRMSNADAAQKRSTCLGAGQPISRFEKVSGVLSPSGRELAEISVHEPFDRSPLRIKNVTDGKEIATIQLPTDHEHWNYSTSLTWSPDGELILAGGGKPVRAIPILKTIGCSIGLIRSGSTRAAEIMRNGRRMAHRSYGQPPEIWRRWERFMSGCRTWSCSTSPASSNRL